VQYETLGAHVGTVGGTHGTSFAVWAPAANAVSVVGDHNAWDGRHHPMRATGSGVWELFVPGVGEGARYQYEVRTAAGAVVRRADPVAFQVEVPPGTASIVHRSHHVWADHEWLASRADAQSPERRISIYEIHLGSWRRGVDGGPPSYLEVADDLAAYVVDLGFTHVELLPVMAHPFGGSWGYQVTSFFAPAPTWGTPDELRALVDRLHGHGVGVILDWVPAHFPADEWALAGFDGTPLYEHEDPRRRSHPDWGTLIFDHGRPGVRDFLIANAQFWLREYHADGLRVDAVASMLYLDYSRAPGEWVPNRRGGREDLEAVTFLRSVNEAVHADQPGVMTIAEESTTWPGVSSPTHTGGLGFDWKWNLGWMHDTLDYFGRDPVQRRHHHHQLTFASSYAFSERFMLPLSHDEVVHGKGSLLAKMAGDRGQRFSNLRALYAFMWAHPGKPLLFMGGELAQEREWDHDRPLDWHLLSETENAGVQSLVRDLNGRAVDHPALWELDIEPAGFTWLDADDAERNVGAFARHGRGPDDVVVCVANLSAVARYGYAVGLPAGGPWEEVLNTDSASYGGSGLDTVGVFHAVDEPWHGQPWSTEITLPPLAVLWLAPPVSDHSGP
jgi:1,4-alpha-glucan branching enzyme